MREESRSIKLICTVCPQGCHIEVTMKGEGITGISGYDCQKGREYAIEEVKAAKRIVMSVVKVKNGDLPTVAVKTNKAVPKENIKAIMDAIAGIEVKAPIEIGDVLVKNVAGFNVDIVATRRVNRAT